MAQKMLYIRDNEEEMFEEALNLSGMSNFSSMISEAVQAYIQYQQGFREVYVLSGFDNPKGKPRKISFIGKHIDDLDEEDENEGTDIRWVVFQTRRGQIMVWRQEAYTFAVEHRYYLLHEIPENGILEKEALDEAEWEYDENDTPIKTYKLITLPDSLFTTIKEKLSDTDCFLDI